MEFNSLWELMHVMHNEKACIAYLEKQRWNGTVVSPFDPTSKVYKCPNHRYKCAKTNRYFNVKTGTYFEGSKLSLRKWFLAMYLYATNTSGISSYQLARDLGVTQKTAWFVLHRIRKFQPKELQEPLGSENYIEIDETFVGGKNQNRHKHKKVKPKGKREWPDKTPVIGMLERDGRLIAKAIPDTKLRTLTPIVKKNVLKRATVFTDEWRGYNRLHHDFDHYRINHSHGRHAEGEIFTNGIENVWSGFKRMYHGTYIYISPKHLQAYVDEFALRFNTRNLELKKKYNLLLEGSYGRLRYKELIDERK